METSSAPQRGTLPFWHLQLTSFCSGKVWKNSFTALCLPPRSKIDYNPRTHGFGSNKVTAMDFRRPDLKYFCALLWWAENRLCWAHSPPSDRGLKAFEGLNELHHFPGTLFPFKECFQLGMDMTPPPSPLPALQLTLHALGNKTLNHFPLVTDILNAFSFLKKNSKKPGFWQFSLK